MKCSFCGAEEIRMETPYLELDSSGEYVHKTTWCCSAQAKNQNYVKNHFTEEDRPDAEDVAKWD